MMHNSPWTLHPKRCVSRDTPYTFTRLTDALSVNELITTLRIYCRSTMHIYNCLMQKSVAKEGGTACGRHPFLQVCLCQAILTGS